MASTDADHSHPPLTFPAAVEDYDFNTGDELPHPPLTFPAAVREEHDFDDDGDELYKLMMSLEQVACDLDDRHDDVQLEVKTLRERDLYHAEKAMARVQATPLVAGQLVELVDDGDHAVVTFASGWCTHTRFVRVLSTVDRELLKPSASVLLNAATLALVDVVPGAAAIDAEVSSLVVAEDGKPGVTYDDIGGCEAQKREVREAVELPLTHPELFAAVGVDPPRGVLLHGPPGTGKTMLARAVARHTSAAFIRVNGSEFARRSEGDGPRMVRDVFRLARDRAPAIVFIDEADAVAAARSSGGDRCNREMQRVLMELLTQMDGFDASENVRVIMATNRADELDPALTRPGRLDRIVEFAPPKTRPEKLLVLRACAAGMSLDGDVDLEEFVARHDELTGAEIAAVCHEAGMQAVRGDRCTVTHDDFDKGYRAVVDNNKLRGGADEFDFYN